VALATADRHFPNHGVLAVPLAAVLSRFQLAKPFLETREARANEKRRQGHHNDTYSPKGLFFSVRHRASGPVY
jgi:hypothetical protein